MLWWFIRMPSCQTSTGQRRGWGRILAFPPLPARATFCCPRAPCLPLKQSAARMQGAEPALQPVFDHPYGIVGGQVGGLAHVARQGWGCVAGGRGARCTSCACTAPSCHPALPAARPPPLASLQAAAQGRHRYMVSLRVPANLGGEHFCGGTLIGTLIGGLRGAQPACRMCMPLLPAHLATRPVSAPTCAAAPACSARRRAHGCALASAGRQGLLAGSRGAAGWRAPCVQEWQPQQAAASHALPPPSLACLAHPPAASTMKTPGSCCRRC